MDAPVEVTFRHFQPTDRIRDKIKQHILALENFESGVVSGRVVVDGKNRHGKKSVVEITVELSHRGGIAVGKRGAEFPSPTGQQDFDTALAEAFHVAESQMKHHFKKLRPQDSKELERQPMTGRVVRLNATDRNGFIEMTDGISLFFSEAVFDGDFESLSVGDEVLATPAGTEGPYGPQARQVKLVSPLS